MVTPVFVLYLRTKGRAAPEEKEANNRRDVFGNQVSAQSFAKKKNLLCRSRCIAELFDLSKGSVKLVVLICGGVGWYKHCFHFQVY